MHAYKKVALLAPILSIALVSACSDSDGPPMLSDEPDSGFQPVAVMGNYQVSRDESRLRISRNGEALWTLPRRRSRWPKRGW